MHVDSHAEVDLCWKVHVIKMCFAWLIFLYMLKYVQFCFPLK